MDHIDIPAGSMNVVRDTLRHGMVAIADDVQGIARDLQEIDPSFKLFRAEAEDLWVVWQEQDLPDGSHAENLVTTMTGPLDKRIVQRVREITSGDYDLVAEIEKREAEVEREQDHKRREQIGPVAERLLHAMRKDTGIKDRVFLP